MSKRPQCPDCDYPLTACLCHAIQAMDSDTRVVVLQHPSEAGHAKNSVRLLSRVLPGAEVILGETEADFSEIRQRLENNGHHSLLLYPAEDSISLAEISVETRSVGKPVNLIVIDGTWRKALKIFKLNPWLQQLQMVHLGEDYQGRYRIRKARRPDSLSTLEATAYALAELEPTLDVSPLFTAFDAMVERQLAAMPPEVRSRYQE